MQILPLARARLRGFVDRAMDEEDLLVSMCDRFFRAVSENRFARLNDRDDNLSRALSRLGEVKTQKQLH
jgi:hypothetical protein